MTQPTPTPSTFSPLLSGNDGGRAGAVRDVALPGVPGFAVGDVAGVMRSLSALFWGLPLTLLAFARHFLMVIPSAYDAILPPVGTVLLVFGLLRIGRFQRQERVWQEALFSSQVLGVLLLGLSPFLYMWSRVPSEPLFARAVGVLLVGSLVFLVSVSLTLARLAAMLPDAAAHSDARLFHTLTGYLASTVGAITAGLYWRLEPPTLSDFLALPQQPVAHGLQAFVLVLVLVPVAMSMALTWKLKEVALGVLADRSR